MTESMTLSFLNLNLASVISVSIPFILSGWQLLRVGIRSDTFIERSTGFLATDGAVNVGSVAIAAWLVLLPWGARHAPRINTFFRGLAFALGGIAVLLTYSRRAWTGLAAGGLTLLFLGRWSTAPGRLRRSESVAFLAAAAAFTAGVYALAPEQLAIDIMDRIAQVGNSMDIRSIEWSRYWSSPRIDQVLGNGAGAARYEFWDGRRISVHNSFLAILLEVGVVGFAAFLGAVLAAVRRIRVVPPEGLHGNVAKSMVAVVAVLLTASLAGDMVLYGASAVTLWFAVGFLSAYAAPASPAGVPR